MAAGYLKAPCATCNARIPNDPTKYVYSRHTGNHYCLGCCLAPYKPTPKKKPAPAVVIEPAFSGGALLKMTTADLLVLAIVEGYIGASAAVLWILSSRRDRRANA